MNRSQYLNFSSTPLLTLHVVVKGEFLTNTDRSSSKEGNAWQPLIQIFNEDIVNL